MEIREPSSRTEFPLEKEMHDKSIREELDQVKEIRLGEALHEAVFKQRITLCYDAKVITREFQVGSLVLRRNHKDSREGKVAANWEGSYCIQARMDNMA